MNLRLELSDVAPYWKRLWSMRFILIASAINSAQVAYTLAPQQWRDAFPPKISTWILGASMLSTALAGVSVVVKQNTLPTNQSPYKATVPAPEEKP
jgi:hypothetical protein